jgi:AcrR family transcriptional regulator
MPERTSVSINLSIEEKQTKGERTREKILNTALALFAEKGYNNATMRDIAAQAECSLGLAYRYFDSKEALVLSLYERLTQELEEEVTLLPVTSLAERWYQIELADLARLAPHRESLSALFGAGLAPNAPTQVLGEENTHLRRRVRGVFRLVINEAKDAPKDALTNDLTTLFYAIHLSLVLFWLQDKTENQKATQSLLTFGKESLGLLPLVLKLPWGRERLTRLAQILEPLFGEPGEMVALQTPTT